MLRFMLAALFTAAATMTTSAQVTIWDNPGTGDWFDAGNWTAGVPTTGDFAWIQNGGTIEISSGITDVCTSIDFGTSAGQGSLTMTGGTLRATSLMFGNGDSGFGTISGAGTHIDVDEFVVNIASSDVSFADGTIDASLYVVAGWAGPGTFTQHSGDINTARVLVGNIAGGDGVYTMHSGTIDITDTLNAGGQGDGVFIQHGGEITTPNVWCPQLTGAGEYQLHGGTLNAEIIRRWHFAASTTFTFTGGNLNVGWFGAFAPIDLICEGGTVTPGGPAVDTTTVNGLFDLRTPASMRLDLDSSSSADQVIVDGTVILKGTLLLDLGFAPGLTAQFLIVDNDGADPILGTFDGIMEGGTVSATFGGTSYNFAVTYVGGDGNDVVIGACFGDATGDGVIDFDDLNLVLTNWGMPGPDGDLDGSGLVDFDDLNLVLSSWGLSCV